MTVKPAGLTHVILISTLIRGRLAGARSLFGAGRSERNRYRLSGVTEAAGKLAGSPTGFMGGRGERDPDLALTDAFKGAGLAPKGRRADRGDCGAAAKGDWAYRGISFWFVPAGSARQD